jgi:Na+/H+ antiporter family
MTAVGVNRLFASFISNGIPAPLLPTFTFIIAMLMALATGTSWGTMAILFPLILIPTYEVSGGNPTIFYAVVSAVLGGAVAGDHMSPISDTTVISALACDVTLVAHVYTQAPYVLVMVTLVILLGYLPIGYEVWPNMIGILLGWATTLVFVFFVCAPVISPTGRWDVFTKFCCGRGAKDLEELTADTIKKANGETVTAKGEELEGEENLGKVVDDGMERSPEDENYSPREEEEEAHA